MKTPRELLLHHHRAAAPKLDELRRAVLADLKEYPAARERTLPVVVALKLWRELIWSARRIWAGFAVVWLVIITVNLAELGITSVLTANANSSVGILLAWEQRQKFLAELNAPEEVPDADKPKPSPRPHSQRHPPWQLG